MLKSFWKLILSFFRTILSHIWAWTYDRMDEPPELTQKRRELVETLPRNVKVLEVGAGTGTNIIAGVYEGSAGRFQSLTLVEPDDAMRKRLESKLSGRASGLTSGQISVVSAALPNLPFPDGSFDAVVVYLVLSHVRHRRESIKELARVLTPSGRLLFIDHPAHEHHHAHGDVGHGTSHDTDVTVKKEDEITQTETTDMTSDQTSQTLRQRRPGDTDQEQSNEDQAHHHGNHDGHGEKHRTSFFWESLRWKRMKKVDWDKLSLEALINDFQAEPLLEELFERRIPVDSFFFKEISYGCFVRKPDPDA